MSQMFPDNEEGNELKFSGEFSEVKDPKTGNTIKVPKELNIDELIGHVISTTRETASRDVKKEFEPLMTQIRTLETENANLSKIQEEYQKLKESQMSEVEKAQANFERLMKESDKTTAEAKEEASYWKDLYKNSTIRGDILSSFGDTKLFNPGQVALLFENEGRARLEQRVGSDAKPIPGEFDTIVTLKLEDENGKVEEVEGTPGDLFKRWIDLPRNFHHIQNDLTPGNGTPPVNSNMRPGSINWEDLPPTERLNKAREKGIGTRK